MCRLLFFGLFVFISICHETHIWNKIWSQHSQLLTLTVSWIRAVKVIKKKKKKRRAEDEAQPRKVEMNTLVSRLRVACHQRSGKYSTWWRNVPAVKPFFCHSQTRCFYFEGLLQPTAYLRIQADVAVEVKNLFSSLLVLLKHFRSRGVIFYKTYIHKIQTGKFSKRLIPNV